MDAPRPSAWIKLASWLLVAIVIVVVGISSSQTISGYHAHDSLQLRSLQEPSYVYEGKPEPAWILLGNACGPIRDGQDRYVMYAADVQVPPRVVNRFSNGPAPTASAVPMTCDEFSHWTAKMLVTGKAKAFAASAPEYQAWCSEDEVVHHSCR